MFRDAGRGGLRVNRAGDPGHLSNTIVTQQFRPLRWRLFCETNRQQEA